MSLSVTICSASCTVNV